MAKPLSEHALFFREGIRDPGVASLFPTLRSTVRHIIEAVDFENSRLVVEYGPGTGVMTRELLAHLTPNSRLVVIERNRAFAQSLRGIDDKRLTVIEGSALDVIPLLRDMSQHKVDCVISGIPFSALTPPVAEKLVADTRTCLRPEGKFVVYQIRSSVLRHLQKVFASVQERWVWHIPPYRVYEAQG